MGRSALAGLLLTVLLCGCAHSDAGAQENDTPSATAPSFDGEAALALIAKQLEFGPRNPGSKGHAACLRWLQEQLKAEADQLATEPFELADPYGDASLKLTNLRASFYPERTRRIALAAHWDTRPRADQQPGGAVDKPIPGANDGGSGVAVLLAMAVVALPILVAVVPWLLLRLRFFRRKWTVTALAATPAGEQLLALRALTNRPPRKLVAVSADPVGGWRREDSVTIRALATLELWSAGIAAPFGRPGGYPGPMTRCTS